MDLRLAVVQPEMLTGADAPKNVETTQWLRPELYGGIARGSGR
jgi:hypothetical protein